jgi:NAD(P)H-dependent FMN reductase
MNTNVKILAFAGSTRSGSMNQQLLEAARQQAEAAGVAMTVLNLKDLAIPLYDGDLESAGGFPAGVLELKRQVAAHDAVLIASPEYNASVTAVLKNAIDWIPRPTDANTPQEMKGKVVGMLSASPGGLGGIRGLIHLRSICQNVAAIVIPTQFALGGGHQAFAEDGSLKDESARAAVDGVLDQLTHVAGALKAAG